MNKVGLFFLRPFSALLRKITNVAMRDVVHGIIVHTRNESFYLEQRINKLEKQLGVNVNEASHKSMYDDFFYRGQAYESLVSALHVLRPIMGRVETNSVIDFGCGVGTWLCAARRLGAREVYGLDGDYVNRDMLLIDESDFHPCNLEEPVTVDRRFDLAISMEVAEHLHEEVADTFVSSICGVSDIIFFGAAHVGQGGTNHINCQPISYWAKKFYEHGYIRLDIRKYYKYDIDVTREYRQNMSLYVKKEKAEAIKTKLSDLLKPNEF